MKKIILASALLSLAACGGGGTVSGVTVEGTAQGPATKEQAKATPDTLGGDSAGAKYSSEALKGEGMEDSGG